jgi:hypothetical protein
LFKVAILCLDDSFAHTWHSLNQLHEVVTWNAFQLPSVPLFLMRLSQSVVLWQGRGDIQKISLFGKRPSPYYVKNTSKKQRRMTVHHYFKTWRSVNLENVKIFDSFLKFSLKNHQALWRNWLSWGPPQERKTQSYLCCRGQVH